MERIAIIGDAQARAEFTARMNHLNLEGFELPPNQLEHFDLIFDLKLDDEAERLAEYAPHKQLTVIACAVKRSLAEMAHQHDLQCSLFGLNALPTFIQRNTWEMSLYHEADAYKLTQIAKQLDFSYELVADRVGMVTPRIICMIINEACNVLQEGTASVEAVNQAMKLGTNYPKGPFEWANAIGIRNVYDVVSRLQEDTGEGRYKISPLLKQYHLKNQGF